MHRVVPSHCARAAWVLGAVLAAWTVLRGLLAPAPAAFTAAHELACPPGWIAAATVTARETRAMDPTLQRGFPVVFYEGATLALVTGRHEWDQWWHKVRLPGDTIAMVPAWDATAVCTPPAVLARNHNAGAYPKGHQVTVLQRQVPLRNQPTNQIPAWSDRTRVGEVARGTVLRVTKATKDGWLEVRPGSLADAPPWYVQAHDVAAVDPAPAAVLHHVQRWQAPQGTPQFSLSASRPVPVVLSPMGDRTLIVHVYVDAAGPAATQAVQALGGTLRTGEVTFPLYWDRPMFGYTADWHQPAPGAPAVYRFTASPPPTAPPGGWATGFAGLTIVLDPGHGAGVDIPGWKEGARATHDGVTYQEEDITLAIARAAKNELERRGARVRLTREEHTPAMMSLYNRTRFAREADGQVFVSIHANVGHHSAKGVEIYYYHPQNELLAQAMLAHVAAAQDNPPRKATFGSFAVTRQTAMPAVLVEHGYLTFASEAARLVTPDFQQRAAVGIANGLRAWLEDGYSPH